MATRKSKPEANPGEPAATTGSVITDATWPIAKLKPDPRNARRHSEEQIGQIMASIERFGYVTRINVRPDGTIIGGHATLEALKRLEKTEVEVRVVAGLTPGQYAALALALNRIPENSGWDRGILRDILADLPAEEDLLDIGFSEKELDGILAGEEELAVKEIATGPVADEFWISVRGPLKDQARALQALQAAMKDFPEITVDLSTIGVED